MKRPDQDKFDEHSRHLELIDDELEKFCDDHEFQLDKNLYRTPCRVLRRPGNPELIFDVYQESYWLDTEYNEDLPHTFAIAAYYEPSQDDTFILKLEATMVEHQLFSEIRTNLRQYLETGLEMLESWTPKVILQRGHRLENLRKKYGDTK